MKRNAKDEINKWQKNGHAVALFEDEYYRCQYREQFWSWAIFFIYCNPVKFPKSIKSKMLIGNHTSI